MSPLGEVTDQDVQSIILNYLHWLTHQVGPRRCGQIEALAVGTRNRVVEVLLSRGGHQARVGVEVPLFDSAVSGCGHPSSGPLPDIVRQGRPWVVEFGYQWADDGLLCSDIGANFRAVVLIAVLHGGRLSLRPVVSDRQDLPSSTWQIEEWVETLVQGE